MNLFCAHPVIHLLRQEWSQERQQYADVPRLVHNVDSFKPRRKCILHEQIKKSIHHIIITIIVIYI